jgi:hypothetical protein
MVLVCWQELTDEKSRDTPHYTHTTHNPRPALAKAEIIIKVLAATSKT